VFLLNVLKAGFLQSNFSTELSSDRSLKRRSVESGFEVTGTSRPKKLNKLFYFDVNFSFSGVTTQSSRPKGRFW